MVGTGSQGPWQQQGAEHAPGIVDHRALIGGGLCQRVLERWGQGPAPTHRILSGSSGSSQHPPLESKMAVMEHAASGTLVDSALPPVSIWRKMLLWQAHPLSSCDPQQCCLASLVCPGFFLDSLNCDTLHPSPLELSSFSQPQSSPQGLTLEALALLPSPGSPQWVSRQVSQAQECQSALTFCAGLSVLPSTHLLPLSKTPPLSLPVSRVSSV